MQKNVVLLILVLIVSNPVLASNAGKKLFNKLCVRCHVAEGMPTEAPPIFAVISHVKGSYPDREGFVNKIVDWVEEPKVSESLMRGAIRRFGLMPKLDFSEEEVRKVAEYLYDRKAELPAWYKKHYKERHGHEPK